MDRGRTPDDGPDDVEAAPDHKTIDPTADAAGSSAASGESDAAAAGIGPPTDEVAPRTDAPPDAVDDDARPAAWLGRAATDRPRPNRGRRPSRGRAIGPASSARWARSARRRPVTAVASRR